MTLLGGEDGFNPLKFLRELIRKMETDLLVGPVVTGQGVMILN